MFTKPGTAALPRQSEISAPPRGKSVSRNRPCGNDFPEMSVFYVYIGIPTV